jgi:hypothetical protein
LVGAAAGAAVAHHHNRKEDEEYEQQQEQAASQPQYAPAPASAADELEHLAQLHASGVLTDDEFASAKAKVLAA